MITIKTCIKRETLTEVKGATFLVGPYWILSPDFVPVWDKALPCPIFTVLLSLSIG